MYSFAQTMCKLGTNALYDPEFNYTGLLFVLRENLHSFEETDNKQTQIVNCAKFPKRNIFASFIAFTTINCS